MYRGVMDCLKGSFAVDRPIAFKKQRQSAAQKQQIEYDYDYDYDYEYEFVWEVRAMKWERIENFRCIRCGACCRWSGSVLLTERDIASMAARLELAEELFIERYTRLAPNRIQLALIDRADGSCCFLSGNRCSIYGARPAQCRSFPFGWRVAEGCPALDDPAIAEKNIDLA